jgi:phosphoenolpyruvate carboxykinase (ATP)
MRRAKIPCVGGHPADIVFLTCDAFGILPPVSALSPAHAMYHFISGYTSKVPGTEVGVNEPTATFSPCFGGPFLVWHPAKYAALLAAKMQLHRARVWLVNTGWSGGAPGTGRRIPLACTRAILDAIHGGMLAKARTQRDPVFGFDVVTECPEVPSEILQPRQTWADGHAYDATARKLAGLFRANFAAYEAGVNPEVKAAGPTG